jgi:hypothetical protein
MGRINRLKILEDLLERLRKDDIGNNSDVDLILKYLEKIISDPKIGGGSKKLIGFEIKNDINTMSRIYYLTWKKTDLESEYESK